MKKIPYLIVTMAALGLQVLVACSQDEQSDSNDKYIAVKAAIVKESDRALTRTYTGTLEGERQAVVYSRLAEAVEEVLVTEGDPVKADQVLLTIDRYGASSQYTQKQSLYLNAEKNFNKMAFLYKEGAVSESDYDAAKTEYEVAKATFKAVKKMVEVPSPIAGVVTSMEVSPGDLVSVGQELATVATTDRLRVKFGVNADEISDFRIGSDVVVTSESVGSELHGKVVARAGSADPVSRSFEVEALFDNRDNQFRPGMFVRIRFILERLGEVVSIPRSAILSLDNEQVVFVVSDGQAHRRSLELGPDLGGDVVVNSGLEAGDTLVILGQDYLGDGTTVNVTALDEL